MRRRNEELRRKSFLIFGSPAVGEEEVEAVAATIRSGWLGTGPRVACFEEIFRSYTGARFAMALNSCTAGLHLSLLVAGVGPGDEVITSPMTFCSTANAIIHCGGRPVFVDVDRRTMNMNPTLIERAITPRTKAIMPVHLAGRPCDMDAIMETAKQRNLVVIEDAAHAIEAWYHGTKIGAIGDLTCFSFYVTKNIITGEGGMVTTDREEYADKIKMYGLHGLSKDAWKRYSDEGYKHYEVIFPGFKYNMMDIQAAIGVEQMKRVDKYLARRNEIWARYDDAFADLPVTRPEPPEPDTVHARHLYTLLLDIEKTGMTRDEFQQRLHDMNIGTGIHFISVHLHKYYRETFGYKRGDFPNAEWISDRTISLPLSARLTDKDVEDVAEAVRFLLRDSA
ncbi:MAG: DegT/DnrJ/EryC1/StrS family aminotransferase [Candidatus Abyssobacteria bacterium SURF_17]|uniref:DegT/DnrJ/EryC1/StrS family aminotransferase n=1 Tax=Candidatus Abyssobacteria bacterium SURF_17 TaxID=2093361 RepID=A0A419F012_9BACT|nr:MAG: DegT/DnrJ/EryC1/StrS family aminotransferase [Candidatus Abyssubacteria bacterium SURF_17]